MNRELIVRHELGAPLAEITTSDGQTVWLHKAQQSGTLWLVEEADTHGSAAPATDTVATSLSERTLVIGGVIGPTATEVQLELDGNVRRLTANAQNGWLTSFEPVTIPFRLTVRELDAQATPVREYAMDWEDEPPGSLWRRARSRLSRALLPYSASRGVARYRARSD